MCRALFDATISVKLKCGALASGRLNNQKQVIKVIGQYALLLWCLSVSSALVNNGLHFPHSYSPNHPLSIKGHYDSPEMLLPAEHRITTALDPDCEMLR